MSARKILVIGATGMLGHTLVEQLESQFEVVATVRDPADVQRLGARFVSTRVVPGVNAQVIASVERVILDHRPSLVVNCVGIVKQLEDAKKPLPCIAINALFPHQLAHLTQCHGARLVHFSTDCVFSGAKGNYVEDDCADADDLYGRTKYLGEVSGPGCLTLRSSIVGHELRGHASLLDWFVSQRGGRVNGFTRALYSGLSTLAMADVVRRVAGEWIDLTGVWHVASDPISKFELLSLVNRVYGLGVRIDPFEDFVCDRRLDSSRLRRETGWRPPSWEQMVADMHADHLRREAA